MKKLKIKIFSLVCACTFILASCGSSSSSQAQGDSSTAATAAPSVTLTPKTTEETSSVEDEPALEITPMMWDVTSPSGTKVTMIGSMHALKKECYPLPDRIMQPFNDADILAVECDTTVATTNFALQISLMDMISCEQGKTLADYIDDDVYQTISEFAQAFGSSIFIYDQYKPWYVQSVLSGLALNATDLDATLGFDFQVLKLAHEQEKEIYEVESAAFQYDLLASFSDETYNLILSSYTADSKDESIAAFEQLFDAWATGDADAMTALIEDENSYEEIEITPEQQKLFDEYTDAIYNQRNIGMTEAIVEFLEGDKNVFYTVGLAHFLGEGGIIDLLEKDGYTVTVI